MRIQSINPFNNQLLAEYTEHTYEFVNSAIEIGYKAFLHWKTASFSERASHMYRCACLLEENKRKLGMLIALEMGKPIREAVSEIEKCVIACRYYAEKAESFLNDEKLDVSSGNAYIQYSPLGLILAVMPWNFPFWQVFRFAAPALMAGNTALLKHAPNVPQCALAIEEIFRDAGFPKGCFTTLLIDTDKVPDIISHPNVAASTLTGGERAGSAVASLSGKYIKKTVLELGGSDPFIVLKDADLDMAAKNAVASRMINCGQSCIAAKRFIIEQAVFGDFTSKFIQHLEERRQGDPLDETTDYSVLARKDLAEKLFDQVKKSIEMGAKLLYGELPTELRSSYFPPLILTDLREGMPAFHEELFGPVACFYEAKDENKAVQIANNSEFGLGGSVWTRNTDLGGKVAADIESGAVYVNKMMASDPSVPFGGIKKSGYGRELSYLGIREFVNPKTIWVGE